MPRIGSEMNIVDPILFHCRHQPEALAFCAPGTDLITYGRLEKTVNNIIARAISVGLATGQVVGVAVRQPAFHAAAIVALARMGIVTASFSGPMPRDIRFDAILTDRGQSFPGVKTIVVDPGWIAGDGHPTKLTYVARGSDICRILLTSGTTGESKGIAVTHDMVLGRILRYNTTYPHAAMCSRVFCDPGWATALGFQLFVYTLGRGAAFFVRGDTAANTLRAFEFYRIDHLVAAPAALAELVVEYDKHRCRHAVDLVHTAGGALSKSLSERVRSRIGSTLISDYGSAETSCVAAAPVSAIENIAGAVGYVTPGIIVEIVDDADRLLPTGEEGIVRIRGDYAATEYVNDPEATRRFFRNGWFYPGDLGSTTRDGALIITGRQTSILNLGGEKIKPEIIEDVLCAFMEGLEGTAVSVVNDAGVEEVWAAIAARGPFDENALRAHCESKLAATFVPKKFIILDQMPRNEMGKISRPAVAELVQRKR